MLDIILVHTLRDLETNFLSQLKKINKVGYFLQRKISLVSFSSMPEVV